MSHNAWSDPYHSLLVMPLGLFIAVMAGAFLAVNLVFAALYWFDPNGLTGARPGDFMDDFFFSVETFGTIGYGVISPRSLYCNIVMTLEVFFGLFNLAIATGLLFARISRPTARIVFSDIAVVTAFEGHPTLMFRAANRRANRVVDAEVTVTLIRDVVTLEGERIRRFFDLQMLRSRTPIFFLSWQMMHRIDSDSPLSGETAESLKRNNGEILVVLKGLDETYASTIHQRASYLPDQILWGRELADILVVEEDGGRSIDFTRFHEAKSADPISAVGRGGR
jgi:inward rectifier potassium channel